VRHIELPPAAVREHGDGLDGALERLGVQGPPVPDPTKVREVVGVRAQPRGRAQQRRLLARGVLGSQPRRRRTWMRSATGRPA
jgi:hypothetical protein